MFLARRTPPCSADHITYSTTLLCPETPLWRVKEPNGRQHESSCQENGVRSAWKGVARGAKDTEGAQ